MKEIFAVMNTTCAVVKIRPEKIIQACTGSQDSGFTAQVVFITVKISFIFSVTNGNKTQELCLQTSNVKAHRVKRNTVTGKGASGP